MSSSSNYYSNGESFDLRYEPLKCDCGLRAAIRVTESDKPSKGRLYFVCEKRNCQFWRRCTPKSVTMLERLRNESMLDQNQNIETVGLKVKNQMLEQSNAFIKQLVVGLLTICIVMYPDAAKFRRMPLQFVDDLDILFSDAAATGEWAYTPSSGVMPQTDETPEEFHTLHDAEFHDDADLEVVHPSELNKKRSSNTDTSSTKSKTKKKVTGAALLNKTLDRIVNVVESSSATSTQTSSRYPSIAECLAKLESIPGVSPDDELYVWAAKLFLRDKRRECFMSLPTDEVRLRFLKLEIEMEKTTIGYRG
ncbi:L10-interacting MYB domain-containing protein [Camellia lanceoleosa]|uniref:L10-interacting MYB domain-containing protein n=1 Tax=Camellia lanceoleosa TaxID=1840588 RepID=A0ACC0FMS9_9ERIC|nr:L10-interacting MYB domain-containing protein [Camellia lanceoleosa]